MTADLPNDSSPAASAASAAVQAKGAALSHAQIVISDLRTALKTDRQVQLLVLLLVASLILWNVPIANLLLYPFKILVSTIGQACAVLASRLTGGTVEALMIDPSGALSSFHGGNQALTATAGALGTSIVGGLLIYWGRNQKEARYALRALGIVMLVLTVFYADIPFLLMSVMALTSSAVLFISTKGSDKLCHILLLMIAVQSTLAALFRSLAYVVSSTSASQATEATIMQDLTGVPSLVWALLWGLASAVILFFSFWLAYRPDQAAPANRS